MAKSWISSQPRKLVDRRRLVELKMQEDDTLFKDIMRVIEPCFNVGRSEATTNNNSPRNLVKGSSNGKRIRVRKPYETPQKQPLKEDSLEGDSSNEAPQNQFDQTSRVSVIKHAPASRRPSEEKSIADLINSVTPTL